MFRLPVVFFNKTLTIEQIDSLSCQSFYDFFKNAVMANANYFQQVSTQLPFRTKGSLKEAFFSQLDSLSAYDKLLLIHRYERVMSLYFNTWKNILEGSNKNSNVPQEDIIAYRTLINDIKKYKKKFGFPFIFSPKNCSITSLTESIKNRLENDEYSELNYTIEVIKEFVTEALSKLIS